MKQVMLSFQVPTKVADHYSKEARQRSRELGRTVSRSAVLRETLEQHIAEKKQQQAMAA